MMNQPEHLLHAAAARALNEAIDSLHKAAAAVTRATIAEEQDASPTERRGAGALASLEAQVSRAEHAAEAVRDAYTDK
jgi:hypothetical protein